LNEGGEKKVKPGKPPSQMEGGQMWLTTYGDHATNVKSKMATIPTIPLWKVDKKMKLNF